MEGDDDVAEFVECPWDWEKEEIEQYIEALQIREIAEVFDISQAAYGQLESWTMTREWSWWRLLLKLMKSAELWETFCNVKVITKLDYYCKEGGGAQDLSELLWERKE